MKLIKHYDFTKMTELDADWNVAVGDKWSNREIQQYHNNSENLFLDNEGLHLKATYDDEIVKSARINTKHNFFFRYGKIEVIAKIPTGVGTWPAIWMMPQENTYGHWPKSGEIDIMEHTAQKPDWLVFSLHSEAHNHRNKTNPFEKWDYFPGLTNDFHNFGMMWEENQIIYFLDDQEVARYVRGQNGIDSSHKGWPFIHDFYLLLNLAIGGMFGGSVDFTCFPQEFIIRDVKVYQK